MDSGNDGTISVTLAGGSNTWAAVTPATPPAPERKNGVLPVSSNYSEQPSE
jgi:hypothetical protein